MAGMFSFFAGVFFFTKLGSRGWRPWCIDSSLFGWGVCPPMSLLVVYKKWMRFAEVMETSIPRLY
ncbi:MAG: hypothetical protein CM1200mP16_13230 [Nitrospina sp.]|nr:MAG: hypothetical protein CM1200mP16_13230 [Nitrospina sp.]